MIGAFNFFSAIGGKAAAKWKKFYDSAIVPSHDSAAKDTMQLIGNQGSFFIHNNEYWFFYTGNANDGDVDRVFLAKKPVGDTDLHAGWVKELSGGYPKVIVDQGTTGEFDAIQVFGCSAFWDADANEFKCYYGGQDILGTPVHKIGLSTSPDGVTWTKQGVVYQDAGGEPVPLGCFKKFGTTDYRGIARRADTGTVKFDYVTSINGIAWTKVREITAQLPDFVMASDIIKIDSEFYIIGNHSNSGEHTDFEGDQIHCVKTTDFTTFTDVGALFEKRLVHERGLGACSALIRNGQIEIMYNALQYRDKFAGNGGESFMMVRAATLNRAAFQVAPVEEIYPSFVKRYWPLYHSTGGSIFSEILKSGSAVKSGPPAWTSDKLLNFTGDFGLSFNNNLAGIDLSDFALKARVELPSAAGLHPLFSIANPNTGKQGIQMFVENQKLKVILSGDGAAVTKNYTSVDNITMPSGIGDVSNAVYLGFILRSGTLQLCINGNANVNTTKTVDSVITTAFNHTDLKIDIGKATNAGGTVDYSGLDMRSVTLSEGITDQQWKDLDL